MSKQPKLGKQRNGAYEYWGATIDGERVRFGRTNEVSRIDAETAFHEHMAARKSRIEAATQRSINGLTVESLCIAHGQWHLANNKKKTTSNRLGFLQRFCQHEYEGQIVGGMLAANVTKEVLASFMEPMEPGWTAWNYCVAIKAAWNWATREGKLPANPLARYPNPPQPKADVSEATLMTEAEVKWFLEKSEPYGARSILDVLFATGARPGELCSATVSDYISSSKQLRLLNWKNGRKTNTSRIIPLSNHAAAIVASQCKKKHGSDPIFTGPENSAWTPNRLQKIWRKIRNGEWRAMKGGNFEQLSKDDAAKRKKQTAQRDFLSLYDLRHLWISDALQQGVPIATIAKMAGTSIKMIERTYGHFRNDDLGNVANEIASKRQIR